MKSARRLVIGSLLAVACCWTTGCRFLPHNLQPHRLYRWNRHTDTNSDPYFSIPSQIPEGMQNSETPGEGTKMDGRSTE